jgi:hypothetical protein
MTYDLHLFRVVSGGDPLAAAKTSLEAHAEHVNAGPIDAEGLARKKPLVAALQALNPALLPCVVLGCRHIELEDLNGVLLLLHDDAASVTVPYGHQADVAGVVWSKIWRYLEVLHEQGQFLIYDSHLDRVVDLSADREAVVASYARG